MRTYGVEDKFFSLQTPPYADENTIEYLAGELERAVSLIEKATGLTMSPQKLAEACELSNEAREYSLRCNELRFNSPPLLRGAQAIYFSAIFSQLWGRPELVEIQKQF